MQSVSAARLETYVSVLACYVGTLTSDFTIVFFAYVRLASAIICTCATFDSMLSILSIVT